MEEILWLLNVLESCHCPAQICSYLDIRERGGWRERGREKSSHHDPGKLSSHSLQKLWPTSIINKLPSCHQGSFWAYSVWPIFFQRRCMELSIERWPILALYTPLMITSYFYVLAIFTADPSRYHQNLLKPHRWLSVKTKSWLYLDHQFKMSLEEGGLVSCSLTIYIYFHK